MQPTKQNPFAVSVAEAMPVAKPDTTPAANGHVSGAGQWVFNNHASFGKESPVAWYGVRNVVANMVGIAGLIGVIVGVRKGMGHGAQWAEKKGYNFLSNEFSRTYTQNALGVGASFATFRTIYKTFQRSYDDVFVRPKNAEEASQAVTDLPKKLWQNFKQIGVVEYPVTMIGGFVLVGIRSGIAGALPKETVAKKNFLDVIRDKHTQRDIAGCALFAYPAFFEVIEHLGGAWQKNRGYKDPYHNEHVNKDKQGMKETFIRQIPGVAAGIVPYIAFNSWAHQNIGRQFSYHTVQRDAGIKAVDKFATAYRKEMPFQYFWMYTLGRDMYFDAYDKLTGKAKEAGSHAALPSAHADVAMIPSSKVEQVDTHGKAVHHTAALAV